MGEVVVVALAVVAIVLIAGISINGIVDKVMREKRWRYEAGKSSGSADITAIAERTREIEERLRVLERIATDRGSLLSEEIEALRRDNAMLAAPSSVKEGATP